MMRLLFWLVFLPNLFAMACIAVIAGAIERPSGLRSLVILYLPLSCFPLMLFGTALPHFIREWMGVPSPSVTPAARKAG